MAYPLRSLLFRLDPERSHALALNLLRIAEASGLLPLFAGAPVQSTDVMLMGLRFPGRVGIAAGLDKNGLCIDGWQTLGASFVEVGTVTPKPQAGNPRPRIFRLQEAQAIINRMGFPNEGAAALCARLAARRRHGICGVNIGKNASTPLEQAADDYVACLKVVAPYADYIAVNVSSPNTAGLRSLQAVDQLRPILQKLIDERAQCVAARKRPLPLLVKLAPDLSDDELQAIATMLREVGIDGVIATNTTLQRPGQLGVHGQEAGGLSGVPLRPISLEVVRKLRGWVGADFPIIGVGGIGSAQDALAMRQAGADLVQVYSALIYRGPGLLREIASALR